MASRTFQYGSGCFKCSSCGRLTRHTTSDNPEICGPCYDLAGLENGVQDGHPVTDYLEEAVRLYQEITSKGGTFSFCSDLGPAVLSQSLTTQTQEFQMATKTKTVAKKAASVKTAAKAVTKPEMAAITQALGLPTEGDSVARKPVGTVSVKEAVLGVFQKSPDKEFRTDEVVKLVHAALPKAKDDSILWTLTLLKKDGHIHRTRNDGHAHVLKFGPGAVVKPAVKASPAAAPGNLGGVLKELVALVEQRDQIDARIAELKKLI